MRQHLRTLPSTGTTHESLQPSGEDLQTSIKRQLPLQGAEPSIECYLHDLRESIITNRRMRNTPQEETLRVFCEKISLVFEAELMGRAVEESSLEENSLFFSRHLVVPPWSPVGQVSEFSHEVRAILSTLLDPQGDPAPVFVWQPLAERILTASEYGEPLLRIPALREMGTGRTYGAYEVFLGSHFRAYRSESHRLEDENFIPSSPSRELLERRDLLVGKLHELTMRRISEVTDLGFSLRMEAADHRRDHGNHFRRS